MTRSRKPLSIAIGVAAVTLGINAAAALAADVGTSKVTRRSHTRSVAPAVAQIYHSGGFYRRLPGDAYVASGQPIFSNPFSYNPVGDVGDYDDGPRCTLTREGAMFFLGHRFARLCR